MVFHSFEKNIQSQFGEDGVIKEIFNRIGTSNKICVEFGAWDGIHLSNAWNLWHNEDWEALLIEGDHNKFDDLLLNSKNMPKVNCLNVFVTFEGENSLDNIFEKKDYPNAIDFVSIDIDGDDYYIFENLNKYRPRLILVEYNPTIPPYIDLVQQPGEFLGCSALALYKISLTKGYKLVHMTDTNMFFVRNEDFPKLKIVEQNLNDLFPIRHLTNVITGYDGQPLLTGVPTYMSESFLSIPDSYLKTNGKNQTYRKVAVKGDSGVMSVEIYKV